MLYVPSLGSNLLSVKKLTKEGYKLVFEKDICHVEKDGKPQAAAKLFSELYEIQNIEKVCTAGAHGGDGTTKKVHHSGDCINTWQRRFGHRNTATVERN